MKVPSGIYDRDCDVARFLFALRNWEELNPYSFYQALASMNRPDLIAIASNITWLCVSEPTDNPYSFYQALASMNRPDLIAIASNITWLCVSEPTDNPYSFYQALASMNRPDLTAIAINITWLCVSEPTEIPEQFKEPLSMKTLLSLLRTEISQKEWIFIAISLSVIFIY